MKESILLILVAWAAVTHAQRPGGHVELTAMGRQQKLDRWVPAGNYSGICALRDGRYAVVSDKARENGYFVWHIDIDTLTGRIRRVDDLGFRSTGLPGRDVEGIAVEGETGHVCIACESDNRIVQMDASETPQVTATSESLLTDALPNSGLESLCYDAVNHCLWTMEERGANETARLLKLDTQLRVTGRYDYPLDAPTNRKRALHYARGVSEVLPIDEGRLLVLEREAFVPKRKIGAWVKCKLYVLTLETGEKTLLTQWKTRLNLTARSWANYEGMCYGPTLADGSRLLLVISDSQNRFSGVLHDWGRVFKVKS